MMQTFSTARRYAALTVAALSLGLAACSEEDAHEVEVDFMRITTSGSQIMVNSSGAPSGTITLLQGQPNNLTVEFLDANMENALTDHADEFQVQVTPNAGITFTRTGPFTGTLTGTAAGVVSVSFALLHIEENHEDFGPFPVNITVVPPATAR
jgi:hypothetical protein